MQRVLPRASRAFSSLPISTSRTALRRPSPFLQPRTLAPLPQRLVATRWYSESTEAKKETAAESEPATTQGESAEQAAAETAPEDPVKKELETAKKEILDLKVS